jgi:hypothetical protein
MKNIFRYILFLTLILISITVYPQESKLYKWDGDWVSISGNCPYFCIQRKFIIERKGQPSINANLVLSHTTWNGSNIQFITLDRQYIWISEYHDVSRISSANSFIGRAYNQSEAIRVAMDDAVRSYLNEEAARIAESEKKGSSFSQNGKKADNTRKELVTAEERNKFRKDSIRIILDKCEGYIAQQNYDKALAQVALAIAIERDLKVDRSPEVLEMEKRLKRLITERDEKIAADKKKQKDEAELRGEKKKKKLDKKVLFAGNPGNKPYPNPYDNPDPEKPVYDKPSHWKDYPETIKDESILKKMYDDAVRMHDGYKLLQLAKRRYNSGIPFAEIKDILSQVHTIAKFNRDPWLMYHMGQFYYDVYRPVPDYKYLPAIPGVYLKEAYDLAVLRNDPTPLYELYLLEKTYDLIPELTDKDISKTRYEMMQ